MNTYHIPLGYRRNTNAKDTTAFELGKDYYNLNGMAVKHHIDMELVVGYRATPIYDKMVVTLFYKEDILL